MPKGLRFELSIDDVIPYQSIPEKRLLGAMIIRAIMDLLSNDPENRRSAYKWFTRNKNKSIKEKFTFAWSLQQLDLEMYHERIVIRIFTMKRFYYRERLCYKDLVVDDFEK